MPLHIYATRIAVFQELAQTLESVLGFVCVFILETIYTENSRAAQLHYIQYVQINATNETQASRALCKTANAMLSQPQVCVQNKYIQRVAKFQCVQINFQSQTQSVRDKDTRREGGECDARERKEMSILCSVKIVIRSVG